MSPKLRRSKLVIAALALGACAALYAVASVARSEPDAVGPARQQPSPAQPSPAQAQPQSPPAQGAAPVEAATLKPGDVAKLRWIEGSWRGTGDIDKPFYERYRVEGDAVIVEGFEDEAFGKSSGATRFELKEGRMGGGNEGWRWVVTKLDESSVTFGPVAVARNSFRWERVSADEWRAVLEWPATADKPARRRVYKMERWPRPAGGKN